MYMYLILVAVVVFVAEAKYVICNPMPDCSSVNCSVDCKENSRTDYVACNCCESCASKISLGYRCIHSIKPRPGDPTGPNVDPRAPTNNAIYAKGLHCDKQT